MNGRMVGIYYCIIPIIQTAHVWFDGSARWTPLYPITTPHSRYTQKRKTLSSLSLLVSLLESTTHFVSRVDYIYVYIYIYEYMYTYQLVLFYCFHDVLSFSRMRNVAISTTLVGGVAPLKYLIVVWWSSVVVVTIIGGSGCCDGGGYAICNCSGRGNSGEGSDH